MGVKSLIAVTAVSRPSALMVGFAPGGVSRGIAESRIRNIQKLALWSPCERQRSEDICPISNLTLNEIILFSTWP